MYKAFSLLGIFVFCSCNNENAVTAVDPKDTALSSQTIHTNADDTVVTNAKPMVLTGCYQMILKRDTANLNLIAKDSSVSGSLHYDFYEKDKNTGTLKGVLRNDTIYADYTFQSEGRTSVREVVFRIQDGTLLQGFGNLTEQNSRIVFQNPDQLQFQTDNPFLKVPCR